ncbi:unnamed protein product [Cyprideis torosa]|uniref:Uncharacterized protein n=1 Tax=Cyprideis torosa TaxID=163714 RepID=A0A7R8ZFJ5_9CRUS|nr:unnamed protein product [Cyprideis torosa]CAG0879280.1 unnamed protein product [Cyprideis torosa]
MQSLIIASFLFAACSASYIGSPLSRTTLVGPSGVISTGDYGYGVPLGLSKTIVAGPTLLGKSLVGPTLLDRTLLTRSIVGPSVIGSKLIAGPGLIGGYGAPLGLSKTIGYGGPLVSGYGLAGPTLLAGPAIRACYVAPNGQLIKTLNNCNLTQSNLAPTAPKDFSLPAII